MCGRFHNHVTAMHEWVEVLRDWPADHPLGYNVSPTQTVPVLSASGVASARWGLVPHWEKTFATQYPTHNARLETVAVKPTYRSAWRRRQTCLVPVVGFYEWKKEGSAKQPYFIHNPGGLLVFAGLWERWNDQMSFTILTTGSRGTVAKLHHRMPVMLDPSHATQWLSSDTANDQLLANSAVCEVLDYYPVSTEVNNSRSSGPACAQRCSPDSGANRQLDF